MHLFSESELRYTGGKEYRIGCLSSHGFVMALDDDITKAALAEVAKKAAAEAWEKKNRLLPLLRRVWDFFRGRATLEETTNDIDQRGIVILGPGGTGKTTFARVLTGDVNVLIDPPGFYDPSEYSESVPLMGSPEIELVVMPGQAARLSREFGKFTADLVSGAFRGVILVVDYGHHAIQSEWSKDHQLYEGNKREFVPKLLASQRQEELELLDRLIPALKAITRKLWVLVVVLKQDLWAQKQADVVKHYRDGAWGEKMNDLVKALDPKLFDLHTAYASLHIQNYTTKGGRETLKKNAAGYDSVRQRESLISLFQKFDLLREWEENS